MTLIFYNIYMEDLIEELMIKKLSYTYLKLYFMQVISYTWELASARKMHIV